MFSKRLSYLQNGNGATYTERIGQKLKMFFQENKHEINF